MRLGLDLGGTKIEGVVLDDAGLVVARRREATPRGDYRAILACLQAIVTDLESETGRRCTVGIGMPGTFSPHSGLVRNSNTTELNGRPLDRDLEALLERPLRFENDANCFALSEAVDGAARGASGVFGVIIGTGTGGGLVIRGDVWRGRNAIGGEWGHNPLPWMRPGEHPGPDCYCGRRGCLETWLSGTGLTRAYTESGGEALPAASIAERIRTGEGAALAAFGLYADRLARGLAAVINVVDPDCIVLGGGLSNIGGLAEATRASLSRYVFSDQCTTPIVTALHGDSSGVRGAAWLWPAQP